MYRMWFTSRTIKKSGAVRPRFIYHDPRSAKADCNPGPAPGTIFQACNPGSRDRSSAGDKSVITYHFHGSIFALQIFEPEAPMLEQISAVADQQIVLLQHHIIDLMVVGRD